MGILRVMVPFEHGKPAPELARWIERYVGYRMIGGPGGIHRGLPSGHPTFIVGIGETINVIRQTDPRQSPREYRALIGGFQATHALISHQGHQEGISIELTPLGVRALFGVPVAELWDLTLELDEVAGRVATELWERLQTPAPWPARFAICDEVLGRTLRENTIRRELDNAWKLLVGSAGNAGVEQVADRLGWSRQNLTRRFRREFGLSPKLAGRLIRFERAREMLGGRDGPAIADVAASCGYFDQAHMNRDFVEFAGLPPGQLRVEEEVSYFQDGTPVPAR